MASTDPLGSSLNPIVNPKTFTWVDPTANTPQADGTVLPFNAAAEVTGYLIGVRNTAAGTQAGTYPIQAAVASPTAVSDAISAVTGVLVDGVYAAAIQTVGPQNSPWSNEVFFLQATPVPIPMAPSSFTAS